MYDIIEPLRKAYIDKLKPFMYEGVEIPICDTVLTKPPANITTGNALPIQAYIIIQNQTLQDDSAQCCTNQNTQLQLVFKTLYQTGKGNSGGFQHSDRMAGLALQILFPNCQNIVDIQLNDANMWRAWLDGRTHIYEEYSEPRVFSNVLIFNHSIQQLNLTT